MNFPDPDEPFPKPATHCTKCGDPFDWMPIVRFARHTAVGRVELGAFHEACAPKDMDKWLSGRDRSKANG